MDVDGSPITGLDALEAHLQDLLNVPDTELNEALFDEVSLQLTGSLSLFLVWSDPFCVV